ARASGHGIGKSAFISMSIKWGMDTCEDCKVVVTANIENQLRTKTWPEIAKWQRLSLTNNWFTCTKTAIYSNDPNHANARGGYGVILDECRDTIIDGVQFKATDNINNNDGRHLLYVSQGGNYHEYNGCLNTICTNTIANYKNKNNRNHWAYNIRKSKRNILSNFIADSGNGGIANNNERGPIENSIYTSGHIHQVQYENGIGVYGTSFVSNGKYHSTGWIINSVISEVSVKNDSITGADSIGFGVSGNHGILSSCITKVPSIGIPIMVQQNTNNLLINNIVDYTETDEISNLSPMILFSGGFGTMKNITV
ncbi:TPA: hypothetical protein ACKRMM_006009, partial [Pseudomonas aeruginosa]